MMKNYSPYLKENDRLADVIAAIQAMGAYKFYKLDFVGWAERISANESMADHWKKIFEEHPEFFRLDTKRKKASLVWRRQHQKLFDVDKEKRIEREDYRSLSDKQKKRFSRMPLDPSEISTLIDTAMNLHSRALEYKRDSRWWFPAVIGLIGVIIGATIKALTG